MAQIVSPAQKKRMAREREICRLFDVIRGDFSRATMCYNAMAEKIGCSTTTIIAVLKSNNKI